uniref:Fibronectin type-III domain-containing protein n=1 Tax=Colobus angolensis palliatus TaxID=336983 RepID=A0A2K5IGE0_COLAP
MLTLQTWLVPALFIFLTTESIGELLDPCGYISPESPVVQLHSNFTAVCVLKEKCMDYFHVNANYIVWKTNHFTIPKEQYTIINRTASSVTFTDISSLNIQLTCNILTFGQLEQNVYGITIISGCKFCFCLISDFVMTIELATHKFADCKAKRDTPTSCTVDYSTVYFVNIEVWVEAENALGKVTSDHINFDPVYKVKPNPPHNLSVINSEELSSILKLTWTNPSIKSVIRLKYNIQYRTKDASTWSQIPPEDTASTRSSFTVQDLKPFTEYVFRIRCMKEDGKGYWSDWSEEANGITYEDTNGKILDYEVTLTRWKSHLQNYTVNDTKLTVNLTNDRYVATLTARNLVGKSDGTVLTIPACDFQGNLAESKCYLITVTPVYADGPGSPESIKAYLKQAPPSKGPTVRTKKVGKNEAVLEWDQLPVDVQNGFIRNYTIFYRTIIGNETAVNVDSSHTEYTLSSLTSDTLYMVRMAAYTDEGGKDGPEFTFTTPKFAQGEIEAIVVPVCLAFLLTTLLGVLFCFNKRDLIKKHIWPNVPDPSKSHIAQWSPHTPPRHNFNSKDQIYSDGNFTDVSVVEIEANDKKPFPEDLKSLDLFKKEKINTEGHSSGIGGSSCMSSSRPSISSSDENESSQNTSSTVQYSTVVHSGYRHQVPSVQVFSRSESTQPLLDSEERPEDLQLVDHVDGSDDILPRQQYFKQNCSQHESSPDISHFERSKQVSSVNEEDFVRLKQQISDHISQSCGSGEMKMFQEVSAADAFGPGTEGQVERFETIGMEATIDEGMPKSYLPQTVRQGGYMPQ